MAQQRFAPILANLIEFLRQRRYRFALSILGFLALVKIGSLKLHLLCQGLPYCNERSILVEFGRVVSKWVTWALLLGACRQHHEANRNCDDRNQCRDTNIRHALSWYQILIRRAAMACSYRLLAALDLRCISVVRLHFYAARRRAD